MICAFYLLCLLFVVFACVFCLLLTWILGWVGWMCWIYLMFIVLLCLLGLLVFVLTYVWLVGVDSFCGVWQRGFACCLVVVVVDCVCLYLINSVDYRIVYVVGLLFVYCCVTLLLACWLCLIYWFVYGVYFVLSVCRDLLADFALCLWCYFLVFKICCLDCGGCLIVGFVFRCVWVLLLCLLVWWCKLFGWIVVCGWLIDLLVVVWLSDQR